MSTETPSTADNSAVNGIRTALGLGGLVALVVGILILVWPGKSAVVFTLIIAIYAIVAGLIYAGLGIFSKVKGGWSRLGHIVLGLVFVAAGVIAFLNPAVSTATFAAIVVIFIGIAWIIEGIVALSTLGDAASKGWSIFFAIVSIIAGIVIIFSPLFAAGVLWLFLAISLIVLGIIQIVRAFTFGKGA